MQGAVVSAYDPVAVQEAQKAFPDAAVRYARRWKRRSPPSTR